MRSMFHQRWSPVKQCAYVRCFRNQYKTLEDGKEAAACDFKDGNSANARQYKIQIFSIKSFFSVASAYISNKMPRPKTRPSFLYVILLFCSGSGAVPSQVFMPHTFYSWGDRMQAAVWVITRKGYRGDNRGDGCEKWRWYRGWKITYMTHTGDNFMKLNYMDIKTGGKFV